MASTFSKLFLCRVMHESHTKCEEAQNLSIQIYPVICFWCPNLFIVGNCSRGLTSLVPWRYFCELYPSQQRIRCGYPSGAAEPYSAVSHRVPSVTTGQGQSIVENTGFLVCVRHNLRCEDTS